MAKTYKEYPYEAGRTLYPVSFELGYIDRSHIKVYIKGTLVSKQFSWVNNSQIQLLSPVNTGETLIIRRVVPRNAAINDYEDGARLSEENLDDSFLQALMILEEVADGFVTSDGILILQDTLKLTGDLDLDNYRIINLADGVANSDGVTVGQLKAETTYILALAETLIKDGLSGKSIDTQVFTVNETPSIELNLTEFSYKYGNKEIMVFLNGVLLVKDLDWEEDESGTSITVIDIEGNDNTIQVVKGMGSLNTNAQVYVDPIKYGVVYGIGVSEATRINNSIALNLCSDQEDAIIITGKIETHGRIKYRSGQHWTGISIWKSGILGKHPTDPTFWDGTSASPAVANITELTVEKLQLTSTYTDIMEGTFFRCNINYNQFTCRNTGAAAIRYVGKALMVDNKIKENYFYECYSGIDVYPSMSRDPTDQWIIDNGWWCGPDPLNPITDTCINMPNASGCSFRGNHPFGTSMREYFRIGGINVSVIDNFFEYMPNPRLYLIHGNPGSFTVTGNKFWSTPTSDTGLTVDYRGEPSALISVVFNEYNYCNTTISGNLFTGGTQSLPVINVRNGGILSTTNISVYVDKSNIFQGSYKLAVASNTATHLKMVQSDHPKFWLFYTDRTPSLTTLAFSELMYNNNAFAESFPTPFPSTTEWLFEKELIINNISTVNELVFSSTPPTSFIGNVRLPPGKRGKIIRVDGTKYTLIQ